MLSLISFLFLISFTKSAAPSYVKSIFGAPGIDEVENEYIDGIKILDENVAKQTTTLIPDKEFSSQKISASDYPYPGHDLNGTCTWALLQEESNNIIKRYSFSNLTQDKLYRHPAAAQQFYSTDEELNNAKRAKLRFTLQPNYERHFLPAFIPPGEIATIEIPEPQVGKLSICLNHHARDIPDSDGSPKYKQRLNRLLIQQLYLNEKTNHVGLPYGATVSFWYSGRDPIEVTVSGVILQPYFYYGMTTDEEWENTLSKLPGPMTYLDTGNIVFEVPSKFIRGSTRMNDAMHYWRSAIQISQTTARDVAGYNNERYGRILNPVQMKYDSFVPAGAAVAFVGGNFCHFPPDWISSVVNYDSATDNPWGTVHEINHHHQNGWANSQEHGEMSNNVVNLCIYAKTNDCSAKRTKTGGLNDWPSYSIAAQRLNDDDEYGLARYSTLIHMFGVDKFKQFVKADQDDLWYPRSEYGDSGAEMLRASHVFNRDMRRHWNFHHNSDSDLSSRAVEEVSWLKLKPFHPVTNYYAVGHVVDGVRCITVRPFEIDPVEQIIDFVSTMVQRENHDWFGDFEFSGCQFEKDRQQSWTEQSKGVYLMKPKENLTEVEEVNVSYRDKTTGDVHVVICQFLQTNNVAKFTRIAFIPSSENNILKAYKYVAQEKYNKSDIIHESYRKDGIFAADYINGSIQNWISIEEGMLSPSESGSYVFYITTDPAGCFYLSEEPLKGDPDEDYSKMINYQAETKMSFDECNTSKAMNLDSEKVYYFRHIVFSSWKGRSWVGYKKDNKGNVQTVPGSWFRYKKVSNEEIFNAQFRPNFERMYLMDEWNGQVFKRNNNQQKWDFYKYPKGAVVIDSSNFQGQNSNSLSIKDVLTDGEGTTEYRVNWWPSNVALAFPHIFEIDMVDTESFTAIKIGRAGNPGLFGSKSLVQIFLAPYNYTIPEQVNETEQAQSNAFDPTNYTIDQDEALIWEGWVNHTNPEVIELDKEHKGRYLRFKFLLNNLTWKDGHPGRTCISAIEVGTALHNRKVYPITNRAYVSTTGNWQETRDGCYYNGKGLTGFAGATMTIRIPKFKPEIGIIGDFYPGMGTADVLIDNEKVGTISKDNNLDPAVNARRLTLASRSYKSLLFYYSELNPEEKHELKIEVKTGSITLAGILAHQMIVRWNTDDDRYPTILRTEFDDNPVIITDWDTPSIVEDDFVPPSSGGGKKKGGLSTGAIVAIVIVVIVVVAAAAVGVFIMYKKEMLCFNKNDGGSQNENPPDNTDI